MKQGLRRKGVSTGLAAGAALALAIGGSAPAFAADYQLGEDDITPFQVGDESSADWNYNTWHIGTNTDPDASLDEFVTFNECSITLGSQPDGSTTWVQVLKGFDIDARPLAALEEYGGDGTLAEFQALIESVEIEVLAGSLTLQIPVFEFDGLDGEPFTPIGFTTIRSVVIGEGVHQLADLEITDSQGWSVGPTWADAFDALQGEVDDDYFYEILGVGFNGNEGAEVASISFAGDTYYFGTGDCTPDADDEDEDDDDSDADDDTGAPTPPESVETDA